MDEARDTLEDFLEETRLPIIASKNIIKMLRENDDTDWEIYGKYQILEKYENFSSLIFTLELLNERNKKLHKIYNHKLNYLYKTNN